MKNGIYCKVLDSSVIKSVIYDKANSYLYVHFHTGSIWQYEDVGLEDYYDLITSKSAGVYFNKNICFLLLEIIENV